MIVRIKSFWLAARAFVRFVLSRGERVRDAEYFDRLQHCYVCPHYLVKSQQCSICTCYVPLKAMLRSEQCPDNPRRWK